MSARRDSLSPAGALALAAASGVVALSWEIVWFRAISYVTVNAPWTFGAILGAYLAGVALSALLAARWSGRHPVPGPGAVGALGALFLGAVAAGYLVLPALGALAALGAWVLALPLVAVAAGALGCVLPLVAHLAIPPDVRVGSRLSQVYMADIAGSAAGSVLTGYVLLDVLPLPWVNALVAACGLVAAALAAAHTAGARRVAVLAAAAAAAVCALTPRLHDRLWERLQWGAESAGRRFAEVVENRHGVIAITSQGTAYGGGGYDGAFNTGLLDDRNGIFRAYALAALHPAPRRVLFIGLGTGSWAQVIANLPGVEHLTAIEVNPGYVDVIRRRPEVASLLANPRVEVVVDDARRWLTRHPDRRFDVIVSNVTLHWRAHATGLLSVEFVRLAKAHLARGGVYYFNTTWFRSARETAIAELPHGLAIGTFVAASEAPISYDRGRLAAALAAMRIDGRPVLDTTRPEGARIVEQLAHAPLRSLAPTPGARIITDDNMLSEWHGTPFPYGERYPARASR